MKSRFALATIAAVAAAAALAPTAAYAQTDTTSTTNPRAARRAEARSDAIDEVKSRCLNQIDRRQKALSELKARLANAKFLTDAHQAALDAINEQTSSGLSSLADTIQSEDNFEQLKAECRQIVEGYRVFALVRPRARLVLAADRELTAVTKLNGVADRIQSAIDKAKSEGRDTSKAEADLATMRAAITSASSHASGVYDAVIHLTPADYNANHGVLDAPRAEVRAARDSLKQAVAAGRDARQSLKPTTA
jgi:hypothetical protein